MNVLEFRSYTSEAQAILPLTATRWRRWKPTLWLVLLSHTLRLCVILLRRSRYLKPILILTDEFGPPIILEGLTLVAYLLRSPSSELVETFKISKMPSAQS